MDDPLTRPFEPCVIVYDDPVRTEMILRDDTISWRAHRGDVDVGYDMETGKLVAIRITNAKEWTV